MGAFNDPVTNLNVGSLALLKSFIATDGAIDATYRGKRQGKKKERFVVMILGMHVEGEPPFQVKDALEHLGFFYDEKRDKSIVQEDTPKSGSNGKKKRA